MDGIDKDVTPIGAANTPDQFAKLIVEDRNVAEGVVEAAGMEPE